MLIAQLPFDYIQLIDRGDRIRRVRIRPNGGRVRARQVRREGE